MGGQRIGGDHSEHDSDPAFIVARERTKQFKREVKASPYGDVHQMALKARDTDKIVRQGMPKLSALLRTASREKEKVIIPFLHDCIGITNSFQLLGKRAPVKSLADIVLTNADSKILIHGPAGNVQVPFILYDDGAEQDDRIMMFGTHTSLAMVTTAKRLHVDGTFKVQPSVFAQLFVVHAERDDELFPAVYVLLPNKSLEVYNRMWQVIMLRIIFENTRNVRIFSDSERNDELRVCSLRGHGL